MIKNLILITSSFPYGIREVFLENEIKHLSKSFSTIYIFSINNDYSVKNKRDLPPNCTSQNIYLNTGLKQKFLSLLNIFSIHIIKEFLSLPIKKKLNHRIISTFLISYFKAKIIKKEIQKKINYSDDLFYLYSYWGNDGAIAITLVNNNNTKKFCRVHGSDLYFESNPINYLPFRKTLYNNLDVIFTISEIGNDYINNYYKIKSKIIVSKLGVEPHNNINHILNKTNKIQPFKIVSCSNLIPLKRVHLIIESLSLIKELEIIWIHFGDGIEEEKLTELANKRLHNNITVEWKGRVSNHDVIEFYKKNQINLFINVSTTEGIPVSIMEAMSFGIPCIATNVGGTNEIVTNNNGKLISSNPSTLELKVAILNILNIEPEKYHQYVTNAFLTWKNNYNSEINYEDFIEKINQL
jgi:colanic acid/amylovoran biosynthesis glycosyltransferase